MANLSNEPVNRWVVVANRTDAVIYRDGKSKFVPVEHFLNPEGNKKEGQLDADRPGRTFSSAPGTHYRYVLNKENQRHEETIRRFSSQICKSLQAAQSKGLFDELVLVAEPHFLGVLKKNLTPALKKKVTYQLNREYLDTGRNLRKKILTAIRRDIH